MPPHELVQALLPRGVRNLFRTGRFDPGFELGDTVPAGGDESIAFAAT
jgi:hypothetical protein